MARPRPPEVLLRQRLATLTRALPAARRGDIDAIHAARVASRRLREVLPLVTRGTSVRKLEKLVRRLTRALGPVRELDVALMTIDELQADSAVPAEGIVPLRQTTEEERQRLCAGMGRQLEGAKIAKLGRKALTAAERLPSAREAGLSIDPRRLAAKKRASRRALALEAALENAGGIYLPDRLHQVRLAVKKLRYAVEIDQELRGSRATSGIRTLKTVQDLLGRMHDFEMLIMRIRALQGSDRAPALKLSADLDRLVRRLETECRQLHVRYMGFKRKLLDLCDHVTAANKRGRRSDNIHASM